MKHCSKCGVELLSGHIVCGECLGRSVTLPCNVGDTVYIADFWGKRVQEYKVNWIVFDGERVFCYNHRHEQPITPDIWGKTVFLTYEAAKAAMEKGNNHEEQQ